MSHRDVKPVNWERVWMVAYVALLLVMLCSGLCAVPPDGGR